jgi:leucyl-tRNA synthetase
LVRITVETPARAGSESEADAIRNLTHRTIKRVTHDLGVFQFNTQIAAMIEMTNELMRLKDSALPGGSTWRYAVETLVSLVAPSAPYRAEEMWQVLGMPYSVHSQPWPAWDEALTIDAMVEIVIQINGKPRDHLTVPAGSDQAAVEQAALGLPKIVANLDGRAPKKIIYVPDRLLNIVG